jgi:metal-dependent amidase/aminoacylase/carboxypeptidase family protein
LPIKKRWHHSLLWKRQPKKGGSGKVYMVREGLFKDVDVVFSLGIQVHKTTRAQEARSLTKQVSLDFTELPHMRLQLQIAADRLWMG